MKKTLPLICLLVSCIFLYTSCEKDDKDEQLTFSTEARDYLAEIMDIMENNSINKYTIDWSRFRSEVLSAANGAETIEDTYPGIERALELLGDNHSFYVAADGNSGISASTISCDAPSVTVVNWPDNIGYVRVGSYSGNSNDVAGLNFAKGIQLQIKNQDSDQLAGWIVDLRGNTGGNMWPMLAGIGPILGEGTAGYFVDPDDNRSSWGFSNGASVVNGSNQVTFIADSYDLINPNPKTAVLLDNRVASSGEVIAISFIGRDDTRSFGNPTCGLSTSNRNFNLSDGAVLYLTSSYLADRNLNNYGIPIDPDVQIDNDEIIQAATEWILE